MYVCPQQPPLTRLLALTWMVGCGWGSWGVAVVFAVAAAILHTPIAIIVVPSAVVVVATVVVLVVQY